MSGIEYYEILIKISRSQLRENKRNLKILLIIFLVLIGAVILFFLLIPSNEKFSLGLYLGSIMGAFIYSLFEFCTSIADYIFTKREILDSQALREQLIEFDKIQNQFKDGSNVSSVFPGQYL
jgi:cell shape-determining protein MreC